MLFCALKFDYHCLWHLSFAQMPSNFSRGPLRSTQKNKRKNTHAHIKITGHGRGLYLWQGGRERQRRERERGSKGWQTAKSFFSKIMVYVYKTVVSRKWILVLHNSNKEANRKNNWDSSVINIPNSNQFHISCTFPWPKSTILCQRS